MTKTAMKTFRRVLEAVEADIGNGSTNREALAIETSPDELDRIQHAGNRDYAMRSLERHSSRLREVRTALRHIEAGTFGICAGCGEEISPKRLAAVPWTSFCIICQEAADREQRAPGDEADTSLFMAA